MNQILTYISGKSLKEGDRLPPERELAEELGISRRALRQALADLELTGRIWRGRRNGTFLGRRPPTVALGVERRLGRASPKDILEARLALEPTIAAIAAVTASEGDLATIENCMYRTAEVAGDDAWVQWDGAFHLAIAQATRNEVFVALVTAFNASRAMGPWRRTRIAGITAEKRTRSVALHREIVDALRQRSPDAASEAMRRHILGVKSHIFR